MATAAKKITPVNDTLDLGELFGWQTEVKKPAAKSTKERTLREMFVDAIDQQISMAEDPEWGIERKNRKTGQVVKHRPRPWYQANKNGFVLQLLFYMKGLPVDAKGNTGIFCGGMGDVLDKLQKIKELASEGRFDAALNKIWSEVRPMIESRAEAVRMARAGRTGTGMPMQDLEPPANE